MTEELEEELLEILTGRAEPLEADHGTHTYLYVPDLSSRTGWGAHAVPEAPTTTPRAVGFRTPLVHQSAPIISPNRPAPAPPLSTKRA